MSIDDRLSDLLVEWEQGRRAGQEPSLENLCKDVPDLLPVMRESVDSLKATDWMFESKASDSESAAELGSVPHVSLQDTELPASHLTVQEFASSIFQSGLLSAAEIVELKQHLEASDLPGEAREVASKLVTEGRLTRYQASVLLKASKDPLLIDSYVILETLDTGGMGLVFKARHRSMNRIVALKVLPASLMSSRDTVKRFQREVKAAAALQHPNIVAAYDAGESEEIAYLVLEYVEGTNLFRLVREQGPLSVAQAADYVRQAAAGLSYLHSRGIIHRDVKPANLILDHNATVKLLDMGLVRFASSEDLSCAEMDQDLTQAGIVIGTVAYMSPEQALDTRSADQRSDIYSLGCTLFFLLTGRSLYHEETGMKTLLAHREQPVPSIRQFCEDAPVSLDAVVRTMVAKRPADRLQTMAEVIGAIDACMPGLPSTAVARLVVARRFTPRPVGVARPWTRLWRSRRVRISIAVAALAAAVVGGVYFSGILIRVKSRTGTTELWVDDPNAKVEVIAGKEAQPSSETRRQDPTSGTSSSSNETTVAKSVDNKAADLALARKGEKAVVKSVDRQVADWMLRGQGMIVIKGKSPPLSSTSELPDGDFRIEGISCHSNVRVQLNALDIDRLASLTELKWLILPWPAVTDDVVERLKRLTTLTRLSLARTKITDACLHSLAGMTRLSSLDLRDTARITDAGLPQLAAMKSLNDLNLIPNEDRQHVGLTNPEQRRLPNLILNNTHTTEAGILMLQEALPNCAIFASHLFEHDQIPVPPRPNSPDREWAAWLLSFPTIFRCWVYADVDPETPVTRFEDLPPIAFRIQKLVFSGQDPQSTLSERTIRRLSGLAKLRDLYFARLPANAFAGLAAVKQLQSLSIDDIDVTDESLQVLSDLTGLKSLRVGSKIVTDAGLKHLSTLSELAELKLNGRAKELHGAGLEALGKLQKLKTLDLSGSGVDDNSFSHIGRIAQLERLNLSNTWISGTGLTHLGKLEHLRTLDLSACRLLAGTSLEALAKLHALEELDLYDCRIDDAAVEPLAKLTSLRNLELTNTRLTAAGFNKIRQSFPKLQVVDPANGRIWRSPHMHLVDPASYRPESHVQTQPPAQSNSEKGLTTGGAPQSGRQRGGMRSRAR